MAELSDEKGHPSDELNQTKTIDYFEIHFNRELTEEEVTVLKENKTNVKIGKHSKINSGTIFSPFPHPITDLNNISRSFIKKRLASHTKVEEWREETKELFTSISSYADLYFPRRTIEKAEELRNAYCLHMLNHAFKTRGNVISNNAKLQAETESEPKTKKKRKTPTLKENVNADKYRDQGLARPKILLLLPFKSSALEVMKTMIDVMFGSGSDADRVNVMNKKRFFDEFKSEVDSSSRVFLNKPPDYKAVLGGNTEDCFRVGVGVTKKSLKLFTDFYSADIIIASPLGLRMVIGTEEEKSNYEYDFLSGIEILILDQSDVFLMQNWQHLTHVLDHVNLQPKETRETDFSRVKSWALDGFTKFYRQTLIFSDFPTPELNSIFSNYCRNFEGIVKVAPPCAGILNSMKADLHQAFQRFESPTGIDAESENRFRFFIDKILPQYIDSHMSHTLIFIPSYFDFVRVRNHFKSEGLSFVQICEYSEDKKISRARSLFFHGKKQFLLLSERFHFFRRNIIRGIHHLLFYQLPIYPHFYPEIADMTLEKCQRPSRHMTSSDDDDEEGMTSSTCTVIYSKWDSLRLSCVFGKEKASAMIQSDKNVYLVVTDT